MQAINVVLIEDDPMVRDIHRQFVERVAPFRVVAEASNGIEGLEMVRRHKPHLAILDIFMPKQDGLQTLQQLRAEGAGTDVIAITAANDPPTIRRVLQLGALDYIMKPFKYDRVKSALEHYLTLHRAIDAGGELTQLELDRMLKRHNHMAVPGEVGDSTKGSDTQGELPKGLQGMTLKAIRAFLLGQVKACSAEEVSEGVGLARVTARRYLEYMEKSGELALDVQYGGVGRPVNRYRMKQE
ncbi:two-component system response regulator [Paenibacillus montanisoli]|uniref:Transcriptional regulatory protein n=2 Tax=Paenibacillus montanisoli TaxID=2081970 RepID=A0A328UA23_9BACL|nr:two-component system response regulator [Paenibacillus montanisoli]